MLTQPTFLFNIAGGPGSYTTDMFFSDASKAQFLAPGDTLTDRLGVPYSVVTWAGFPTDYANGSNLTVSPLAADVAPASGLVLGDSDVATPGQVDLAPQVQTGGSISSSALIEGRTYKYQISAGFFIGSEANKAGIGDNLIDVNGKVFEITALSGQPGAFAFPFEAIEVDKIGDAPNIGSAYLYRGTPNFGFYQGETLNPLAEDEVRNRDEILTDLNLLNGAGAISASQISIVASGSGIVTEADSLVLVTESGAVTVTLQGPFDDGKIIDVKDAFSGSTNRFVNPITIVPPSGQTIDGAPNVQILNVAQSYTLVLSSNVWYLT
jgi:hypothetical protein